MLDGAVCMIVALICGTIIKVYRLSIEKSEQETERARAFAEMYKAEVERNSRL